MFDHIKPLIGSLASFAKKRMGFHHPPKLFLKQDFKNSCKALGRTAHYDPQEESITLYITSRHPKDILRSFAHELIHHTQNLRGDLTPEKIGQMSKNYAQDNSHMRNMEKEAYLQGNMCFRDWEDTIEDKDKILIKLAESKFLKENKIMTTKITKNFLEEKIKSIISEKVPLQNRAKASIDLGAALRNAKDNGVTKQEVEAMVLQEYEPKTEKTPSLSDMMSGGQVPADSNAGSTLRLFNKTDENTIKKSKFLKENKEMTIKITKEFLTETIEKILKEKLTDKEETTEAIDETIEENESEANAFAPSHYCIHHGGVHHEGKIVAAEAVQHVEPDENGFISHYDMRLTNGIILEDVAAEDIQVTNASLSEEHPRKKHDKMKKKPKKSKAEKFAMNQKPYDKATALDRKGDDGVSKKIKMKAIAEEKVSMVDAEKALYEERFGNKNKKLFEHLIKSWTK